MRTFNDDDENIPVNFIPPPNFSRRLMMLDVIDDYTTGRYYTNKNEVMSLTPHQNYIENTPQFHSKDNEKTIITDYHELAELENKIVFELIKFACTKKQTIHTTDFHILSINKGFKLLEEKSFFVEKIVMHPNMLWRIKTTPDFFRGVEHPEELIATDLKCVDGTTNLLWNTTVIEHNPCPVNEIYFLPESDYLGVITAQESSAVQGQKYEPYTLPPEPMYKKFSVALVNDDAISKVIFDDDDDDDE